MALSDDDLSEHLCRLADGSASGPAPRRNDPEEIIAAEIDDDPPTPAVPGAGAGAEKTIRKPRPAGAIKLIAAPVLLIVGLLLLIPAVWAGLVLAGVHAPGYDRDDAASVAKAMLVCWPIALSLLAAGVMLVVQVARRGR